MSNTNPVPRRKFPRSDDELSIVGFGGILVMNEEPPAAKRLVAEAVEEAGVNYFDVAPAYGDAEEKLGPAIEPYRDQIFLACKTGQRDAHGATAELEESLRRLRTDHIDLYQMHAITDVEKDVRQPFALDGCIEAFIRARDAGKVRFLGFSAHSVEAAREAIELYDFDSVLFPFSYVTYTRCDFGPQILELAKERNMARLALKAMARGHWEEGDPARETYDKTWYEPISDERTKELALRFTLGLDVTAAVPPGHADLWRKAVEVARDFTPLSDEERAELDERIGQPKPIFGA